MSLLNQQDETLRANDREVDSGLVSTAELFTRAWRATRRSQWADARLLLAQVVQRDPDYSLYGNSAAVLLADVERRLMRERPPWVWMIGLQRRLGSRAAFIVFAATTLVAAAVVTGAAALAGLLPRPDPSAASVAPQTGPRPENSTTSTLYPPSTPSVAPLVIAPTVVPFPSPTVAQPTAPAVLTSLPVDTPSPAPTATTVPTMSPTHTASPSAPPVLPTLAALEAAPLIEWPDEGAVVGREVTLRWRLHRPLAEDEYVDLRVWSEVDAPHHGILWTKDTRVVLRELRDGRYWWAVAVLRHTATRTDGTKEWVQVSEESTPRWFSATSPATPQPAVPSDTPTAPLASPTVPVATPTAGLPEPTDPLATPAEPPATPTSALPGPTEPLPTPNKPVPTLPAYP